MTGGLNGQAEVQSLHADGSIALHTRSAKYGKVSIPPHRMIFNGMRHTMVM